MDHLGGQDDERKPQSFAEYIESVPQRSVKQEPPDLYHYNTGGLNQHKPHPTATDSPHPTTTDSPHPTTKDSPHPTTKECCHPTTKGSPHSSTKDSPHSSTKDSPHPTTKDSPHPTTKDSTHPTTEDSPNPTTKDSPHPTTKESYHQTTKECSHQTTKEAPTTPLSSDTAGKDKSSHKSSSPQNLMCSICDKICRNIPMLRCHLDTHVQQGLLSPEQVTNLLSITIPNTDEKVPKIDNRKRAKKDRTCPQCGKKCRSVELLFKHLATHESQSGQMVDDSPGLFSDSSYEEPIPYRTKVTLTESDNRHLSFLKTKKKSKVLGNKKKDKKKKGKRGSSQSADMPHGINDGGRNRNPCEELEKSDTQNQWSQQSKEIPNLKQSGADVMLQSNPPNLELDMESFDSGVQLDSGVQCVICFKSCRTRGSLKMHYLMHVRDNLITKDDVTELLNIMQSKESLDLMDMQQSHAHSDDSDSLPDMSAVVKCSKKTDTTMSNELKVKVVEPKMNSKSPKPEDHPNLVKKDPGLIVEGEETAPQGSLKHDSCTVEKDYKNLFDENVKQVLEEGKTAQLEPAWPEPNSANFKTGNETLKQDACPALQDDIEMVRQESTSCAGRKILQKNQPRPAEIEAGITEKIGKDGYDKKSRKDKVGILDNLMQDSSDLNNKREEQNAKIKETGEMVASLPFSSHKQNEALEEGDRTSHNNTSEDKEQTGNYCEDQVYATEEGIETSESECIESSSAVEKTQGSVTEEESSSTGSDDVEESSESESHSDTNLTFVCFKCDARFTAKEQFYEHYKTHIKRMKKASSNVGSEVKLFESRNVQATEKSIFRTDDVNKDAKNAHAGNESVNNNISSKTGEAKIHGKQMLKSNSRQSIENTELSKESTEGRQDICVEDTSYLKCFFCERSYRNKDHLYIHLELHISQGLLTSGQAMKMLGIEKMNILANPEVKQLTKTKPGTKHQPHPRQSPIAMLKYSSIPPVNDFTESTQYASANLDEIRLKDVLTPITNEEQPSCLSERQSYSDNEQFDVVVKQCSPAENMSTKCTKIQQSSVKLHHHRVASGLKKAMTSVKQKETFGCQYCRKTFSNQSVLRRHMKLMHRGVKPVDNLLREEEKELAKKQEEMREEIQNRKKCVCPTCGKRFLHAATLVVHRREHSRKNPHVCNICQKVCITKYELLRHKKLHKSMTKEHNKNKPENSELRVPSQEKVTCGLCKEMFYEADLMGHIEHDHMNGNEIEKISTMVKILEKKKRREAIIKLHKEDIKEIKMGKIRSLKQEKSKIRKLSGDKKHKASQEMVRYKGVRYHLESESGDDSSGDESSNCSLDGFIVPDDYFGSSDSDNENKSLKRHKHHKRQRRRKKITPVCEESDSFIDSTDDYHSSSYQVESSDIGSPGKPAKIKKHRRTRSMETTLNPSKKAGSAIDRLKQLYDKDIFTDSNSGSNKSGIGHTKVRKIKKVRRIISSPEHYQKRGEKCSRSKDTKHRSNKQHRLRHRMHDKGEKNRVEHRPPMAQPMENAGPIIHIALTCNPSPVASSPNHGQPQTVGVKVTGGTQADIHSRPEEMRKPTQKKDGSKVHPIKRKHEDIKKSKERCQNKSIPIGEGDHDVVQRAEKIETHQPANSLISGKQKQRTIDGISSKDVEKISRKRQASPDSFYSQVSSPDGTVNTPLSATDVVALPSNSHRKRMISSDSNFSVASSESVTVLRNPTQSPTRKQMHASSDSNSSRGDSSDHRKGVLKTSNSSASPGFAQKTLADRPKKRFASGSLSDSDGEQIRREIHTVDMEISQDSSNSEDVDKSFEDAINYDITPSLQKRRKLCSARKEKSASGLKLDCKKAEKGATPKVSEHTHKEHQKTKGKIKPAWAPMTALFKIPKVQTPIENPAHQPVLEHRLSQQEKPHERRLSQHEKPHERRLSQQEKPQERRLSQQEKPHERRLSKQEKPHERRLSQQEKPHEHRLSQQEKPHERRLSQQEKPHERRLSQQEKPHERRLSQHEKPSSVHELKPSQHKKPSSADSGEPKVNTNSGNSVTSSRAPVKMGSTHVSATLQGIHHKPANKQHLPRPQPSGTSHTSQTESSDSLQCKYCHRTFNSKMLREHRVHSNNQFECCICYAKFSKFNDLKYHNIVHDIIAPLECIEKTCGTRYFRRIDLWSHFLKKHMKDDSWKCLECVNAEEFSCKQDLKAHIQTEHPLQYECNICHQAFASDSKVLAHAAAKHPCEQQEFYKKHNVKAHKQKTPVCQECGTSFPTLHELQKHFNTHKIICELCPKKCSNIFYLHEHMMRRHFSETPSKCPICFKDHETAEEALEHMNYRHTLLNGARECEHCGIKTAYYLLHLKKHKMHKSN